MSPRGGLLLKSPRLLRLLMLLLVEGGLLLLLLLLAGYVCDVRDDAVGWAGRNFAEDWEVDVAELFPERRDHLAGHGLRDDLGLQRFLGDAAIDSLVRRDVVVVTAVADDDVAVVHRPVVSRVEGYPAGAG